MDVKHEMKYYLGIVDEYEVPTGYDCYVWAGTFCVNGIKWCICNGKKYEVLQEDDMTNEDIHDIYIYLERVKNKIIDYLKNILNEYHQTDYSEFKWQILLNFWLVHFLPSMYDKYLKLKKIRKNDRLFHVNIYKSDCTGVALDQIDFYNMLQDDFEFHRYEYSLLIKNMTDVTNIVAENRGNYERTSWHINYSELPEHVENFVNKYKKHKEKKRTQDEMVIQSPYIKFTLYKEIMEKKYGKISGYFLDYVNHVRQGLNPNRILDEKWRTENRNILDEEADEFIKLICKLIGNFIPITYLEEFDYLKDLALSQYKWGLNPKVLLYDCEGTTINELFKIYMMNIDIEHILKVDMMHALSYGLGGYSWYQLTEFQMCDECLVCDESINNKLSTRFIRMPYINFFRLPERKVSSGNAIVYTNYSHPQHRSRLSMYEWNWHRYMKGELEFFKLLDKDVISEMKFRLHPFHKTQWNNKEEIEKIVPEIIFDNEPSFFESMCHAKLVISEIMGAAALEAIGMGKPTIILYNPIGLFVELNENYRDIEEMIRVGIIAETPEKLAILVNSIHNDVDNWWNEAERQRVVKRICNKYIYFPENAKEIWIKKIMAYLEEG